MTVRYSPDLRWPVHRGEGTFPATELDLVRADGGVASYLNTDATPRHRDVNGRLKYFYMIILFVNGNGGFMFLASARQFLQLIYHHRNYSDF